MLRQHLDGVEFFNYSVSTMDIAHRPDQVVAVHWLRDALSTTS